jgi:hypothetical protein
MIISHPSTIMSLALFFILLHCSILWNDIFQMLHQISIYALYYRWNFCFSLVYMCCWLIYNIAWTGKDHRHMLMRVFVGMHIRRILSQLLKHTIASPTIFWHSKTSSTSPTTTKKINIDSQCFIFICLFSLCDAVNWFFLICMILCHTLQIIVAHESWMSSSILFIVWTMPSTVFLCTLFVQGPEISSWSHYGPPNT